MVDRNTPGIDVIVGMLTGDPAAIDASAIERELGIAFSKRARKYCDEAIELGLTGTAEGVKGAYEGRVYTRVVLPGMVASGTDAQAELERWDAYITAIESDDGVAAVELSTALVESNCSYQAVLGIAECTATADEP